MDDPADPRFTLSFDLLFRGLEVTTGGQRIHDYQQLTAKIADRGMEEEMCIRDRVRIADFHEFRFPLSLEKQRLQGARCMALSLIHI